MKIMTNALTGDIEGVYADLISIALVLLPALEQEEDKEYAEEQSDIIIFCFLEYMRSNGVVRAFDTLYEDVMCKKILSKYPRAYENISKRLNDDKELIGKFKIKKDYEITKKELKARGLVNADEFRCKLLNWSID